MTVNNVTGVTKAYIIVRGEPVLAHRSEECVHDANTRWR